ncbi:ABC transporter substrate-binding protein [Vineibacter terrae]|uniref:ABC transporter substrate-binding protein n=1 Tax=Vineibacter terrae TaxID=2586908 RepID=UPI002E2EE885|nr:ABC transporter substrate-binding protein [Vineibacter terrae]HEX2887572.1 ABC transporter substrate-binding protein [Vineibacter terrae]
MKRVGAAATVAACVLMAASGAAAQELVLGIFGGTFADNTRACAVAPFEKATGAKVRFVLGSSVQNLAKLRATKGSPEIDVAYMDLAIATQGKGEGLLSTLDTAAMANYGAIYDNAKDKDGRFVGMMYGASAIAYNPKLVKTPPTSWHDLWKPEFKGKLAIGDISGTTGIHFVIAASMINGGSQENTDPGFEAIKKLKPSVVMMYSQADQVVPLFEREEIAIAVWYPDRVGAAAAKGLSVATAFPKEGAIGILPTVSVPEGAKNKALAQKYIDQVLSAETQKCFAEKQYGGPVNKTVTLDDKLAAQLPYGAAVDRMHFPDPETTAKLLPSWSERWGREIAR